MATFDTTGYKNWIGYKLGNQSGIGNYENSPKGVAGSAIEFKQLSCPTSLEIKQVGENASLTFLPNGPTILLEHDIEVNKVDCEFAGYLENVDYYGIQVDMLALVVTQPMESFLTIYFRKSGINTPT